MKQLFFLSIVIFSACSAPTEPTFIFTSISGKINHSKTDLHPVGLFTSATNYGLEQANYLTSLDSNGCFRFEIPIKIPTEIRLTYGSYSKILFVNPGEDLVFNKTVSIDIFPDQKQVASLNLDTVIGNAAKQIHIMNQFDDIFNDSFNMELNATQSYALPREFKSHRAKITKRIRRFSNNFIKKHANKKPVLANWIKSHSEYRIAMDYMKYPFKSLSWNHFSSELKGNVTNNYFDFFEEFPVNNPTAFISLNYQNYLHFYRRYLKILLSKSNHYLDCQSSNNCNIYELELAEFKKHLNGKTLDYTLSQQIDQYLNSNNLKFLELGYNQYLAAINDSLLVQEIQKRKKYLYEERDFNYPDNVNFYQSTGTGEQVLKAIKDKHQNRATLLYFWNTQSQVIWNFSPKSKNALIWDVLDDLNFDLVLLAHHTTDNYWKDFIINKGLVQDQWYLNEEQYQFFQSYFQEEQDRHIPIKRYQQSSENFILALDEQGNLVNSNLFYSPLSLLAPQINWRIKQNIN
jgi:hypothetical protein